MKVLLVYGTRPELIKLFSIQQLLQCATLFSGQHFSLIEEYRNLMPHPTHTLKCGPGDGLSKNFSTIIEGLAPIISAYDGVIVQGDTLTTYAAALTAFQLEKKIFYVEAGLRTHNLTAPFPEEGYRQMISRIANVNFAPTQHAVQNLKKENVPGRIELVGNTIVDAVRIMDVPLSALNTVLITIHRRENLPYLREIFTSINQCAEDHPDLEFIFPAHPNPIIRKNLRHLRSCNIRVSEPLPYRKFLHILASSKLIITDSGGIQEEAVCLGKRCLVCRATTERPEGVEAGWATLCNHDPAAVFAGVLSQEVPEDKNPYGDGYASTRIVNYLKDQHA